ncbi:MAG: non-canonical purine NTP pyrophosphatase [Spirochaetaceae bacterium]|jgi:XTP/dITP diphosphohydrolase|nr:non-canonical purine NTP pyrophosphatase [Spirochaetaceae bacterium]
MKIFFASGNAHKKEEISSILGRELLLPIDAGIASFNPVEDGSSFGENALIKARALHQLILTANHANAPLPQPLPQGEGRNVILPPLAGGIEGGVCVLADDSGLCVDALGGRPGIYSARYGGYPKLIEELKGNEAFNAGKRTARFICSFVQLFNYDRYRIVQETLEGEITLEPRGEHGFGYDPVFYLPERACTLAELSAEEKNAISHRGKAARIISGLL